MNNKERSIRLDDCEKTAKAYAERGEDNRAIRTIVRGRKAVFALLAAKDIRLDEFREKMEDWLVQALEDALSLRHRPHPLRQVNEKTRKLLDQIRRGQIALDSDPGDVDATREAARWREEAEQRLAILEGQNKRLGKTCGEMEHRINDILVNLKGTRDLAKWRAETELRLHKMNEQILELALEMEPEIECSSGYESWAKMAEKRIERSTSGGVDANYVDFRLDRLDRQISELKQQIQVGDFRNVYSRIEEIKARVEAIEKQAAALPDMRLADELPAYPLS